MNEQWKEIKGNREIYEISNLGNVRTKDREGARGNLAIKWRLLIRRNNGHSNRDAPFTKMRIKDEIGEL